MTPEAKLKKLKELVGVLLNKPEENITREEFTASFEAAVKAMVDVLVNINEKVDTKISESLANLTAEVEALKQSAEVEFSARRTVISAEFERLFTEQVNSLNFLQDKVRGLKNGKDGAAGKDGSPDTPDQVVDKVNQSSKKVSKGSVEGLVDLEKKVADIPRSSGVAGAKGVGLLVGGVKKKLTAQTLDFTAGSNITITHSSASGADKLTIASTGGGGSGDVVGPAKFTSSQRRALI